MIKQRNRLIRYIIIAYLLILAYIAVHLALLVQYIETNLILQKPDNTNPTIVPNNSFQQIQNDRIFDETVLNDETLKILKNILKCQDKSFVPSIKQRGEYWVLYNYIRAEHGPIRCYETVTYTTHGDFTFLDNLVPLLEKWRNPISLAIHAPGTDYERTINSIRYLRDCINTNLVKLFVTFHIFFNNKHVPKQIPKINILLAERYNCSQFEPYKVSISSMYKTKKKLVYPINVARNIARESALTHFVLASDIELYPSSNLAERFLSMIARNESPLDKQGNKRIYPLNIFEIEKNQLVPNTKRELLNLYNRSLALPFHMKICDLCHAVPNRTQWLQMNETEQLGIFHTEKRQGYFSKWEPTFIATNSDPFYDERLSWDGKSDKMTQAYIMCLMDYDFMILSNAFLVHRPGIKVMTKLDKSNRRASIVLNTSQFIQNIIYEEFKLLYGARKGCVL